MTKAEREERDLEQMKTPKRKRSNANISNNRGGDDDDDDERYNNYSFSKYFLTHNG